MVDRAEQGSSLRGRVLHICVQEQQARTAGQRDSCGQCSSLAAIPGQRNDTIRAGAFGNGGGVIAGAVVDHDDL
jgi:hypothetical protein